MKPTISGMDGGGEFFMNLLNIEKNKIVRIIFFQISCFLRVLCYFQHLKKKLCVHIFFRGGGGGGCRIFFFRKSLLYYFILGFMQHKNLKY